MSNNSAIHFDVFNGDADGICALIQLRKNTPLDSTLITGVKRDIQLLKQVCDKENVASVCALDISMEKNQQALTTLLQRNISTFYCDHHRTGTVPESEKLTTCLDTSPEICTSLLINNYIGEAQYLWACTGAFGDNLIVQGTALAKKYDLKQVDIDFLIELGTLINYNGYGSAIDDLHIHPKALFQTLMLSQSPFDLRDDKDSVFYQLKNGFDQDWQQVKKIKPFHNSARVEVYQLPDHAWARRISGTFGNWLANQTPDKAVAVITSNPNADTYTVSVRSPLNRREGADEVCSQFPSGGGRKAAAGINALPQQQISVFIDAMQSQFAAE